MKLKQLLVAAAVAVTTIAAPAVMAAGTGVDAKLPAYRKVAGVSGNLSSVGSDTLANLMTFWAEDYKKIYPDVNIQIQAAGSATAPPALIEGTSNLGPMSREMKDNEVAGFEKQYGYKPTRIPVAIDALAVFVHKDNPLRGLTLQQVDAIFSSTRKCGGPADISHWAQLGLAGALADRDLQLFGRNSLSGTYAYFREHALCKGDYKPGLTGQPDSAAVVQSVAGAIDAIGYSGIGYVTPGVRALPIAREAGQPYQPATPEKALSGEYPLSRYLYIYVNRKPGQPLPTLQREFLELVLSRDGQEIVVKEGFIPLPAAAAARALHDAGIR